MTVARVLRTAGALHKKPRASRRRRRCDGHMAEPHWIEKGDLYVLSSLPPGHEIGNTEWWHHRLCSDCWPEPTTPTETKD